MSLYVEALGKFRELLAQAQAQLKLPYPNAMSLATVGKDGKPSVRTVLLKGLEDEGLVFYTNQRSRKSEQLAENPQAAAVFYWQELQYQVLVEGRIETVTDAEADEYWLTRPLQSRIGAWASQQSQPLANREELKQRYDDYAEQFGDNPPRPPHWSGYRLKPERIEFWHEQPYRLHERICYSKENGVWEKSLLNP